MIILKNKQNKQINNNLLVKTNISIKYIYFIILVLFVSLCVTMLIVIISDYYRITIYTLLSDSSEHKFYELNMVYTIHNYTMYFFIIGLIMLIIGMFNNKKSLNVKYMIVDILNNKKKFFVRFLLILSIIYVINYTLILLSLHIIIDTSSVLGFIYTHFARASQIRAILGIVVCLKNRQLTLEAFSFKFSHIILVIMFGYNFYFVMPYVLSTMPLYLDKLNIVLSRCSILLKSSVNEMEIKNLVTGFYDIFTKLPMVGKYINVFLSYSDKQLYIYRESPFRVHNSNIIKKYISTYSLSKMSKFTPISIFKILPSEKNFYFECKSIHNIKYLLNNNYKKIYSYILNCSDISCNIKLRCLDEMATLNFTVEKGVIKNFCLEKFNIKKASFFTKPDYTDWFLNKYIKHSHNKLYSLYDFIVNSTDKKDLVVFFNNSSSNTQNIGTNEESPNLDYNSDSSTSFDHDDEESDQLASWLGDNYHKITDNPSVSNNQIDVETEEELTFANNNLLDNVSNIHNEDGYNTELTLEFFDRNSISQLSNVSDSNNSFIDPSHITLGYYDTNNFNQLSNVSDNYSSINPSHTTLEYYDTNNFSLLSNVSDNPDPNPSSISNTDKLTIDELPISSDNNFPTNRSSEASSDKPLTKKRTFDLIEEKAIEEQIFRKYTPYYIPNTYENLTPNQLLYQKHLWDYCITIDDFEEKTLPNTDLRLMKYKNVLIKLKALIDNDAFGSTGSRVNHLKYDSEELRDLFYRNLKKIFPAYDKPGTSPSSIQIRSAISRITSTIKANKISHTINENLESNISHSDTKGKGKSKVVIDNEIESNTEYEKYHQHKTTEFIKESREQSRNVNYKKKIFLDDDGNEVSDDNGGEGSSKNP